MTPVPGNPALGFENDAMEMAAKTWTGKWWELGGGGGTVAAGVTAAETTAVTFWCFFFFLKSVLVSVCILIGEQERFEFWCSQWVLRL